MEFVIVITTVTLLLLVISGIGSAILFYIITKKLNSLMANLQDFQAAQARQNVAILNIAEDIKRQVEELKKGGLTESEEQGIYEEMVATATKLEEIAAVVPEPVIEEPTEGEG